MHVNDCGCHCAACLSRIVGMGNTESTEGLKMLNVPAPVLMQVPMPDPGELEERFALVLNSMNLPPDKARLLRQYDSEKKWDLICDQERFQAKNPPDAYIQKLQGYLDSGAARRKFRRRVSESAKVLQDLEISLRTNHIGWVRDFLSEENSGLDVLVEYLSVAQSALSHSKANKILQHVSQRDDVHVCIMCLRAVMNYQYGFNLVMSHAHAVNEIALSLNDYNYRTKALVLELLAAVCLVRGGHEIILSAFDHFKQVCREQHRFERLMEYFRFEDGNLDFMVACMQFINIVVHSVEDMNFRVHLQYEFTRLGLDDFLEKARHTESDKLLVQIQAYLDNVFDVGGLLEDAETKNVALEKVEELEEKLSHVTEKLVEVENETVMKVAELEKRLLQKDKELIAVKVSYESTGSQVHTLIERNAEYDISNKQQENAMKRETEELEGQDLPKQSEVAVVDLISSIRGPQIICSATEHPSTSLPIPSAPEQCISEFPPPPVAPPLPGPTPYVIVCSGLSAIRIKKPIKTKFRLPVFNWSPLKPNQIMGTVFNELDDERVLQELDLEMFEELFKTRAQGPVMDLTSPKGKASHKAINKVTLLDVNRSKNLAITLRKAGKSTEGICKAIQTFDLEALPVDFVECLMRFLPTEAENELLRQYERERRPLDQLAEEDRFMLHFGKIERLLQRMTIIAYVGNFTDNINMLMPQLNAIIAASASVKSSPKLRKMLEIILALGNYMNSNKRGSVYGFKLQSLDLLVDMKSTDRRMTLLHYIAMIVMEKFPELTSFYNELHFVDKAALVSLENVLLDVRELVRGMDLVCKEFSLHDHVVLKEFSQNSIAYLQELQKDAKTAEDAYNTAVHYFGENPKTTPPSVFFPVFVRFIKAYKDAVEDNVQRQKQEEALQKRLLAKESKGLEAQTQAEKKRQQHQVVIAELRRRQALDHRPVYEGKDGTIEDIITAGQSTGLNLRSQPFRRADAVIRSGWKRP